MDEERLLAALERIAASLERIERAVERDSGRDSAGVAGPLLKAIWSSVEGRPFSAVEIIDHVEIAQCEALGAAIEAAVGALSPRKLGKLLAAIEGEPFDGLKVKRAGNGRAGLLWQVVRVSKNLTRVGFA